MTWAALIVILVMAIAGSKLARQSFTLLAAMATVVALIWLLAARTPVRHEGDSHASLTRAIP